MNYLVCQHCVKLPQPDNEEDPVNYEEICLKCALTQTGIKTLIEHHQKCTEGGGYVSRNCFAITRRVTRNVTRIARHISRYVTRYATRDRLLFKSDHFSTFKLLNLWYKPSDLDASTRKNIYEAVDNLIEAVKVLSYFFCYVLNIFLVLQKHSGDIAMPDTVDRPGIANKAFDFTNLTVVLVEISTPAKTKDVQLPQQTSPIMPPEWNVTVSLANAGVSQAFQSDTVIPETALPRFDEC